MKMAAINDEEEQNICCEGRIIIESIDEMLNDLKKFSIHHEVKKHEVQTKYSQVMQLEGESSQPSHVDTSVSEDLKKNDVEDDNICCVCTRNSACKTRGMLLLCNVATGDESHKEAVLNYLIPLKAEGCSSLIIMQGSIPHNSSRVVCILNLTDPASLVRVGRLGQEGGILLQIKTGE